MSIETKALRAMSDSELEKLLARKQQALKLMIGSHYPRFVAGEIGQIQGELKRRAPRKVLYVSSAIATEAVYKFEVESANGRRQRVYPCGEYQKQTMPESDRLKWFFEKLNITHVDSKFGETSTSPECIKDGVYTTKAYLAWWRQAEQES